MEQLEQEIIGYLTQAKDFLIEELPQFFHEALSYYFYDHLISVTLWLSVIFAMVYVLKWSKKKYNETNDEALFAVDMISVLITVISLANLVSNTKQIVKITCAPKMYIFEKFVGTK